MDLANQTFGDRITAAQIVRYQVDRSPVIRHLFGVVGLHTLGLLAREQTFGLIKRQVGAFDMSCVVSLEYECPLLHSGDPVLGKPRGIEKTSRALDPGQVSRDGIGDPKFGLQRH